LRQKRIIAPPVFSLAVIIGINNLDIIGYPLKSVKEGECMLDKKIKKRQLIFSNSTHGKALPFSISKSS
jgi:hypothetical protein